MHIYKICCLHGGGGLVQKTFRIHFHLHFVLLCTRMMALVVLKYKIKKGWEKILQKPAKQVKKKRKEKKSTVWLIFLLLLFTGLTKVRRNLGWNEAGQEKRQLLFVFQSSTFFHIHISKIYFHPLHLTCPIAAGGSVLFFLLIMWDNYLSSVAQK